MNRSALTHRLADFARRQAEAAERHAAAAAVVDKGHAERVAFLMMVPEDLRMAVGIALSYGDDDSLHSWALWPFARWATIPAGFQFPRALVEWLLNPPRGWFLGHNCERCGLGVPLLATWSNDPDPPPSIVVFPACPACGGKTTYMAGFEPGAPT
jgi:hypothetical protein